jgi:CRISPR-associated protein Cmr3
MNAVSGLQGCDAMIEALDVLSLRGNRLFGEAGSYGDLQMPPNPSVIAGALRSSLLARAGVDFGAFARGEIDDEILGTPSRAGRFTLCEAHPARRRIDGSIEPLFGMPADLIPFDDNGRIKLQVLNPTSPAAALGGSQPLPLWPVLSQAHAHKPRKGLRLPASSWQRHLMGEFGAEPVASHAVALVEDRELWQSELRIGIGIDAGSGRAADGRLFSLEAVAPRWGVGIAIRVTGVQLPPLMLRLGGDGHAARLMPAQIAWPRPDLQAIAHAGRARMILTAPGLFPKGWLPTGTREHTQQSGAAFELQGVRGRIVCAATPRSEVISGFDLARGQPKTAQRAAAPGCVYWLDELQATAADLGKLADAGLWEEGAYSEPRRPEGYNRFTWASW